MSEQSETSTDEGGQQAILVRRMTSAAFVTTRQIVQAVAQTLSNYPITSVSIALVNDPTIAGIHEQYLNISGPTDVITFDLRDDRDDASIEGEIVVSVDTARRQAEQLDLDVREELLRYVIHGALHLIGLDDRTPAQRGRMRRQENRILSQLQPSMAAENPTRKTDKPKHQPSSRRKQRRA